MTFRRYDPDQVNTRRMRLSSPLFGAFEFSAAGNFERQIATTMMPSGQAMSTSKIEAGESTGTVLMADRDANARLERWADMTENGADGYIQVVTLEYLTVSGRVGGVVEIEEFFVKGVSYPETDEDGDGGPGRTVFTFSYLAPRRLDVSGDVLSGAQSA